MWDVMEFTTRSNTKKCHHPTLMLSLNYISQPANMQKGFCFWHLSPGYPLSLCLSEDRNVTFLSLQSLFHYRWPEWDLCLFYVFNSPGDLSSLTTLCLLLTQHVFPMCGLSRTSHLDFDRPGLFSLSLVLSINIYFLE